MELKGYQEFKMMLSLSLRNESEENKGCLLYTSHIDHMHLTEEGHVQLADALAGIVPGLVKQ